MVTEWLYRSYTAISGLTSQCPYLIQKRIIVDTHYLTFVLFFFKSDMVYQNDYVLLSINYVYYYLFCYVLYIQLLAYTICFLPVSSPNQLFFNENDNRLSKVWS